MVKKIKNLTEEEMKKICVNHSCHNCPLFHPQYPTICMREVSKTYKEILEKKVEVKRK